VIANGWMLRVDLRFLAPLLADFVNLVQTWDSLSLIEPYFHVPADAVDSPVAVGAPFISQDYIAAMGEINFSPAIVYRADWLIAHMLSTLEGGKYYQFAGLAGKTQAEVFASFGLDENVAKLLNGDQRAATLISGVTGKTRRTDRYQGLLGRFNSGSIWITRDKRDNDRDARTSVFYNALSFDDTGREAIFERADGLHNFALFTDQGVLIDAVPPDIAVDHMVPAGHTNQLAPAISCIRCHGAASGLQVVQNDMPTVATKAVPVFDQDEPDAFLAVTRIAGLYFGDFDRALERGRQDYDAASIRASGMTAAAVSAKVAEIYGAWRYDSVTPELAARELGIVAQEGQAVELLQERLAAQGQQDPMLAALMAGSAIARLDWDRVYVDAFLRVLSYEKESSGNAGVESDGLSGDTADQQ